jgi:Na+-transporting methylmalonyl-CoA/oxaloacetate decarboxylase gamma subunit
MIELISSGINLMLTGMITVFIFLAILIVLINVSALLFKDDIKSEEANLNMSSGKKPHPHEVPKEHVKIINLINKRIFNG